MAIEKGWIYAQIVVPEYLEHVMLSKQRRAKYYHVKGRVPNRYLNKDKFSVDSNGIVINKATNEKVLANPRSAGTPKMMRISGQDIWAGMNIMIRSKIAKAVKKSLEPYFKNIKKVEEYPIGVALDFYRPRGKGNWDIDNHSLIYRKCIFDYLKDKGVIEDDSISFITSTPTNYFEVNSPEERKLVITIYKN